MVIDAHAHIYAEDEQAYPVIPEPLRPPPGSGTVAGLQGEMQTAGVDRALLVQTSTYYEWDNSFVRDIGVAAGDWARTIVTLDPEHPHTPDVLFALVDRANARGVRTYPVGRGDSSRTPAYDHPANQRLIGAAVELGITVNVLIGDLRAATELARVLTAFSGGKFVLDHCLALEAGSMLAPKLQQVIELASFANVVAKLTFLPTGSAEQFPFADMHDACRQIIAAYGADRCVWGSDYPTELWCPKASYAQHLELFQEHLGLDAGEREAILGGTAERLWFS